MRILSLIVFLLLVGCGEGKEKDQPLKSKNKCAMKGGESSVIAPIRRAKETKSLEENRQSKLKEALKEEGL